MSDEEDAYSEDDHVECEDRDALDADEYGVSVPTDAGRGFDLTILDADGNRTSRLAQRFWARGLECNLPVFLQEYLGHHMLTLPRRDCLHSDVYF